jgi:hypothetical protein
MGIPLIRAGCMAFGLFLVLSAAAAAEQGNSFLLSDRNGDGSIDQGEFYDRMVELFYFADRNRDRVLVPAEADGVTADRNDDGRLSLSEFTGARVIDFNQADSNRDGLLSRDEAAAAAGPARSSTVGQ